MDPREVVLRAIAFRGPPRLPMNYGTRDLECSDVATVGIAAARGFTPRQPGQTEWGYTWHTLDGTLGQPGSHPLADWRGLDRYLPPDPSGPERTAHLPAQLAANRGRFVKANMGITGYNQATSPRGFEAFSDDLVSAPDRAARVLDLVFDLHYADRLCRQLGAFDGGFTACIEDYSIMGMTDRSYQWLREAFGSVAPGVSRPLPCRGAGRPGAVSLPSPA